jgi:hypothetical protein
MGYTQNITMGNLWLIVGVSLIVSGLVFYVAVRAAILHALAIHDRERPQTAVGATSRAE